MKEQAAALHRAGEYEEAAEEFARAAAVLETAGGGALAPPPALNAIRLSLAASQLKVRRCDQRGNNLARGPVEV